MRLDAAGRGRTAAGEKFRGSRQGQGGRGPEGLGGVAERVGSQRQSG